MIDLELRTLVLKRLDEELHGDGAERSGVVATIISGAPREYSVYRDMCGYVRGIEAAKLIVEEAVKEITQFTAPPETKPRRKGKKS